MSDVVIYDHLQSEICMTARRQFSTDGQLIALLPESYLLSLSGASHDSYSDRDAVMMARLQNCPLQKLSAVNRHQLMQAAPPSDCWTSLYMCTSLV